MLTRVSSLRFLAANVSKLAATRRTAPAASNLLLHTSADCNEVIWTYRNTRKRFKPNRMEERVNEENEEDPFSDYDEPDRSDASGEPKRWVAVLLAGCGHYDGSVPQEVMSLLLHLENRRVGVRLYGPEVSDHENRLVNINHIYKTPKSVVLNPLMRIAEMLPGNRIDAWQNLLQEDEIKGYDGVFVPGGEGLLKFPFNSHLYRVICKVSHLQVPLATISNAGVLAAWALSGVRITIGSENNRGQSRYDYAADYVQLFRGQMQDEGALGVAHDEQHKVFSTPGYLDHLATYFDVHCGIGTLVDRVLENPPQRVAQN